MSVRRYRKGTNPKLEINEHGNEQGIDPRKLELWVFGDDTIRSLTLAVRAKCLDCCCNQPKEVRLCTATDGLLWPFRMGVNIFRCKPTI